MVASASTETLTFNSRQHPGDAGVVPTFMRAYARPLPFVLLPLMVVALSEALQGSNVNLFFQFYFPLAFAGAAAWTVFVLSKRTVAITFSPRGVCLQTALDVALARPCHWHAVYGLRRGAPWITFAWGHAAIELEETLWPDASALFEALRYHAADRNPELA